MAMSEQEAARRYLQASMAAGYTGLPDEHREAHEATMRKLERQHENVRLRALAGAAADFDKALTPGEREHQAYLRDREGMKHADVLKARRELRGGSSPSGQGRRSSGRRRAAVRAGARAGKAYARAHKQVIASSGIGDAGSLALQALGVGIGLALIYLALSPNGSKAFSTLLAGISKFVRLLVGPFDPLNPGGSSSSSTSESIGPPGVSAERIGPGGAVKATPRQRAKLGPAFGPGPGIGTPITPVGVSK